MNVRHRVAATALCLAAAAAWPGPERLGAQRPELEPRPLVAVIDQRLLEAAQDPGLDDAARARVRDFPQMDVHVRSSAPEQVRDPARPLRFPGASTAPGAGALRRRRSGHPLHLPHRVTADIVETYPTTATGDTVARKVRSILGKGGPRWELARATTRPPFVERPAGRKLARELIRLAGNLDVALERGTSAGPSVAGLVPADKACVCAVGPVARDLRTPQEAVKRITLVQRSLLVAEFLASRLPDGDSP